MPVANDLEPLLQTIVERAAAVLATSRVSVRVLSANNTRLLASVGAGEPLHEGVAPGFLRGEGLIGWIAQHVAPLRLPWAEDDPRFVPRPRLRGPVGAFLGVPLVAGGCCVGVISAVSPERGYFTEQHERTLLTFANIIAPYLEAPRRSRTSNWRSISREHETALASAEKRRFIVSRVEARPLTAALDVHLPRHRPTDHGANWLAKAEHHLTTIFFDTPSRDLFLAGAGAPLRVHAREYSDPHPSLAEVALDPASMIRHQPALWLEVAWSASNGTTARRRVCVPKRDLPAYFADGTITSEMLALQDADGEAEAAARLAEVVAVCRRLREPLRADCLVHHRRVAWQSLDLHVTFDFNHEVFGPADDLWTRDRGPLTRATLGPPLAVDPDCVVGFRTLTRPPPWLDEILARVRAQPSPYTKFDRASSVVHSAGDVRPETPDR